MEARRGQSSYDVSFWLLIRPNTGFGRAKNVCRGRRARLPGSAFLRKPIRASHHSRVAPLSRPPDSSRSPETIGLPANQAA